MHYTEEEHAHLNIVQLVWEVLSAHKKGTDRTTCPTNDKGQSIRDVFEEERVRQTRDDRRSRKDHELVAYVVVAYVVLLLQIKSQESRVVQLSETGYHYREHGEGRLWMRQKHAEANVLLS